MNTNFLNVIRNYFLFIACIGIFFSCNKEKKVVYKPVIDSEWWDITNQPDLGDLTGPRQEPVDFGVWKAKDGTWQLWSCIRGTKIGGTGRLFYRWEGKSLTDTNWKPMGIAMEADTTLGETFGGLQAPYVFEENNVYYMFYGDWKRICLAKSEDGKTFTRVINESGSPALFTGPLNNTRDPMVMKIDDTYYCYYCGHNAIDNGTFEAQGAVFCRTSKDMKTWSEPVIVSRGGSVLEQTSWYSGDIECPFVLKIENQYILFRNQLYGRYSLNTQYCSSNPLDFGNNNDDYMVGQLHVAAPEIVKEGDQYYIVALKRKLDGMRVAKIKFVKEGVICQPKT